MQPNAQDIITLFLSKSDLDKNDYKLWNLLYCPRDEISVQDT